MEGEGGRKRKGEREERKKRGRKEEKREKEKVKQKLMMFYRTMEPSSMEERQGNTGEKIDNNNTVETDSMG